MPGLPYYSPAYCNSLSPVERPSAQPGAKRTRAVGTGAPPRLHAPPRPGTVRTSPMPAESPEAFSQVFTIRYDECGAGGTARASVHLRLLQELAFAHSAALGFPVAWYDRRRLYWLVRRVHLVVEAPVGHGDALVYVTRIAGARRILARRLNTVRRADDGSPVASALVDWFLTAGGAAPARIPDAMAQAFPQFAKPIVPVALEERRPPPEAAWSSLWIRSSDADPMGHANNAVYLDLLDDAVARAGGLRAVDAHPRTYDLLYHAAAAAGEPLSDVAWFDGALWHYRLERPDGTLLLHGRLAEGDVAISGAEGVVPWVNT